MKTNKDIGYYWAEYTCLNCGTKMSVKVPYGKSMPILSVSSSPNEQMGIQEAPECEYCGSRDWSHGKKPS